MNRELALADGQRHSLLCGIRIRGLRIFSFQAAKGSVRQTISLVTGISDEKAKEISKHVRQAVPKIQTQIQGAQVRVSSKSRDDLQAAIRAVKEHDFGIALQFTNYR